MATNLITKLEDKEYRDAFVASQINIELPFQIRALREKREWTQGQLAEKAGMAQPRISAMETPGKGKFNLDTLQRLASAFDVGLIVRFAPFSEMIEWAEKFSPDSFDVPSFEKDMKDFQAKLKTIQQLRVVRVHVIPRNSEKEHLLTFTTTTTPTSTFAKWVAGTALGQMDVSTPSAPALIRVDGPAAMTVHPS